MLTKTLTGILATSAFATLASAQCQAPNQGGSGPINNDNLCLSQGPGDWTFGMSISDVAAPDISGGNSGYVSVTTLYIFDEGCRIRGTYEVPNCGVPFVIRENFLTQVLTLRSINTNVGSPYFSFDYGDGRYSIRNDQCVCHDESSGLTGRQACRCGFPVDGTFDG